MALRYSGSGPVMGCYFIHYIFLCANYLVVALVLSYSAFTWISTVLLSPLPDPATLFIHSLTNVRGIFPLGLFFSARGGEVILIPTA